MTSARIGSGPDRRWLGVALVCVWLLMLTTFSWRGRIGPTSIAALDPVALLKVGVRLLGLVVLGSMLVFGAGTARRRRLPARLGALGLFAAWALVSVFWSPLPAVSLGQVGSLGCQLALAAAIALVWDGERDTSTVLGHLVMALLAVAAVLVVVDVAVPSVSGLDRYAGGGGRATGLVHATSAAATASLGLILAVGSRLFGGWRWSRAAVVPSLAVFGVLLILARNRASLALTPLALLALVLAAIPRRKAVWVLAILTAAALVGVGALAATGSASITDTLLRPHEGSVWSFGGRDELWRLLWTEFRSAPFHGHGYFVTSAEGSIEVWEGPANYTAHSLVLQVLLSTGIVGLVLFGWGWAEPARRVWIGLRSPEDGRRGLAVLAAVATGWYLVWGLLNATFMGPIQPESLVAFCLLGLVVGGLRPRRPEDGR